MKAIIKPFILIIALSSQMVSGHGISADAKSEAISCVSTGAVCSVLGDNAGRAFTGALEIGRESAPYSVSESVDCEDFFTEADEITETVTGVTEMSTYESVIPESFDAPADADYLSKVASEVSLRGSIGRLKIADTNTDVAVFYTYDLYSLQNIVDEDDSACMFEWLDGSTIIADHVHQGFDGLKYSVLGSTVAELYTANGVTRYICTEFIPNGWNSYTDLTYYDGTPIHAWGNEVIFYTCSADGTITITRWDLIG